MDTPAHGVSGAELADLELLLSGALGPPRYAPAGGPAGPGEPERDPRPGEPERDAEAGEPERDPRPGEPVRDAEPGGAVAAPAGGPAGGSETDGPAGPPASGRPGRPVPAVPLVVPEPVAEAAAAAGALVLADPEGLPLAELTVTGRDGGRLSGPLRPLGQPAYGVFRSLRRSPAEVRAALPAGRVAGVLVDRPLLTADVAALRRLDAPLLLLVTLSPDGVPVEVLVRATLATGLGTVVVVPLRPGTELGPTVAAAYGVTELVPLGAGDWPAVRDGLDRGEAPSGVDDAVRDELLRWRPPRDRRGLVVFFTGLSGSGKSTLARALTDRLAEDGRRTVTVLDGDVVRRELSAGLGFSKADRDLNVRRIGWVAAEVARHGGIAVCAPIAPYAATRAHVRTEVEAVGDFVLVHVATPLAVCEARDRKGLYARARAGLIANFTGVSDTYEEPADADLVLDTSTTPVEDALRTLLAHLTAWLPRRS